MIGFMNCMQGLLDRTRAIDFLAPLALRLYLVPVFWMAGSQKIAHMDNTIDWFGNPDWGLGLPFPSLLAHLAAYTEAVGALLLLPKDFWGLLLQIARRLSPLNSDLSAG